MMNQFYMAILVAQCNIAVPGEPSSYQERFVLIQAASIDEVQQKADEYANRTIPTTYLNVNGETVTWTIEKIGPVQAILEDLDHTKAAIDLFVRSFDDYNLYHHLFEFRGESESER